MTKKSMYFGAGLTLAILAIGFIFGRFESAKTVIAEQKIQENSQRGSDGKSYNFISPLLDCGDLSNLSSKSINEMKEEVTVLVHDSKAKGIEDAAIYFRDLNNGPWFGINERDGFLPASLLKVPVMMNTFKQAMDDPSFLTKQFVYEGGSHNTSEYFKAESELKDNHTYSIDEAVASMIMFSDNNATAVLGYALDTSTLLSSYTDLGIAVPNMPDYAISAKTYGSFFRILYNSTFLSKEYSEKALRLLSQTVFSKGLVAGVPSTVKVSHKFGERQVDADTNQLHDCGIIYYPNRPYLLCVMTRGKDFDKLVSFIAKVSKKVYSIVDQEK